MEKKINIAELLKDCPKGMELDCSVYNDVTFERFDVEQNRCYFKAGPADTFWTTCYGAVNGSPFGKCVIFPKGKTTWEGFVPSPCKFKDGDVIYNQGIKAAAIFYKQTSDNTISHCFLNVHNELRICHYHCKSLLDWRLATEEEKQKLFRAIKDNGYKWNAETKTLETSIVPKFKVGDRIKHIVGREEFATVVNIEELHYNLDSKVGTSSFSISLQREWELIPDKFDITTLVPFESRVLVRDKNSEEWRGQFFSHCNNCSDRPYICIGVEGLCEYKRCIPFKSNEHLLGTTNDCDNFYKTWE